MRMRHADAGIDADAVIRDAVTARKLGDVNTFSTKTHTLKRLFKAHVSKGCLSQTGDRVGRVLSGRSDQSGRVGLPTVDPTLSSGRVGFCRTVG